MEAQFSLFGMDTIDRHLPPIPVTERWNDLERLNKERELVGIYLSAHPLDEYSVILNGICNLHMEQMSDLTPFKDTDVRLGGIVTGLKRQRISKTNQPYGIVMVEDYTGSAEIALFGNDWAQWKGYLTQTGNLVYITGRVQERRYNQDLLELKIGKIEFLPDVKDKLIQSITITVDANRLGSDDVAELCKHIQEMQQSSQKKNKTAASIDVKWNICSSGNTTVLHMKTSDRCYRVNKKLMDYIDATEYMTYKIN
jgi:DNA polymerase-3 subunit alpha